MSSFDQSAISLLNALQSFRGQEAPGSLPSFLTIYSIIFYPWFFCFLFFLEGAGLVCFRLIPQSFTSLLRSRKGKSYHSARECHSGVTSKRLLFRFSLLVNDKSVDRSCEDLTSFTNINPRNGSKFSPEYCAEGDPVSFASP